VLILAQIRVRPGVRNTLVAGVGGLLLLTALLLLFQRQCPATSAHSPVAFDARAVPADSSQEEDPVALDVRPSPIAGSWYPGSRAALDRQLREFLTEADPYTGARPLGLVCPHAGYRYSGATAAWAFKALQQQRYDRVFILGPSHGVALHGLASGGWTHYETPLGRVPVDTAAVERLSAHELISEMDAVDAREHSLEMEVPFLQVVAMGTPVVPLVVGDVSADEIRAVAAALRQEVGPGDLVVVSSDFTHIGPRFGYEPDVGADRPAGIRDLDMGAFEAFSSLDVDRFLDYRAETGATVCGFRPMAVLAAMLAQGDSGAEVGLRHYDTSGAMTGDWSNSVSYVAAVATGPAWNGRGGDESTWRFSRDEQLTLLKLARDTIRARLDGREAPPLDGYAITDPMRDPSGAFVTLTIDGRLRGCIGEIPPTRPLVEVVQDHAIDAAFRDPRFSALTADEFDHIHIDISALTPPRQVAGHEDIVLGRDGIFLIKGMRRAVYLPQVAVEQGWDLEQTLSSLARKAGLGADAWQEGCTFETFQAQVFHE